MVIKGVLVHLAPEWVFAHAFFVLLSQGMVGKPLSYFKVWVAGILLRFVEVQCFFEVWEVDFVEVLEVVFPLVALVESSFVVFSAIGAEGDFSFRELACRWVGARFRPVCWLHAPYTNFDCAGGGGRRD